MDEHYVRTLARIDSELSMIHNKYELELKALEKRMNGEVLSIINEFPEVIEAEPEVTEKLWSLGMSSHSGKLYLWRKEVDRDQILEEHERKFKALQEWYGEEMKRIIDEYEKKFIQITDETERKIANEKRGREVDDNSGV